MSYRPICDTWILARAKLTGGEKYYGAYLGGFPERARVLLGITLSDPLLHVCGGKARFYPYKRGFGPNDKTLDLNATLNPDIVHDVRKPLPKPTAEQYGGANAWALNGGLWPAILADPPYSEKDAESYAPGAKAYPNPNELVRNCINAVRIGGRVGLIHYIWPACPKNAMEVAIIAVKCGRNGRARQYTVLERTS